WSQVVVWVLVALTVIGYWAYCRSLGRPILILLCIIMMPLATTELGTDGAITGIMEEPMMAAGFNPLWVLIYTSLIMMILRFFAGPVVNLLTPLGLLATCAVLAILGLFWLSGASGMGIIFAAATLYGIGKTYFWPTMLGVVSEQCPKGGALTLNAIAGIGMLTVGILGGPLIGSMQESSARELVEAEKEGVYETISEERSYVLGDYTAISEAKLGELSEEEAAEIGELAKKGKQGALADVTIFPIFMLLCYLGMIFYFKSKGGYKAEVLDGQESAH
ncbi:MAG: MFS transporter, partial [Verrucomicrobiota bacterium]